MKWNLAHQMAAVNFVLLDTVAITLFTTSVNAVEHARALIASLHGG